MRTTDPVSERPETLVAYVIRRIKTGIAQGDYPPGSRLSPALLAAELGVSHIPIREALTSLHARGYITHAQSIGFFTQNLSSGDLKEIHHLRAVLEAEAYRVAVPQVAPEDLVEMSDIIKLMHRRTAAEDRLRYVDLNRQFHFVAFRRAGSKRLLDFLEHLWDVSEPYAAFELVDSAEGYADHLEQLELFRKRDVDGIVAAMDAHRQIRLRHVERWEASAPQPADYHR